MRTYFLSRGFFFITIVCISSVLTAQDTLSSSYPGEPRAYVKMPDDVIAIDFTMDRWLGTPAGITTRTWSPGISISLYRNLRIANSGFSVASGLTFSSHNVHSNGTFTEVAAGPGVPETRLIPRTADYRVNKSSANYLELPLEFRIMSRNKRPFRLHLGAKGGFLVNFHTKTIDDTGKHKGYSKTNIHDYRYGVYTRLGWNYINLYGYYSLVPLIRENRGDQLKPVSFGISLTI